MKSQEWLETCESFSHFSAYFHSRHDCFSFSPANSKQSILAIQSSCTDFQSLSRQSYQVGFFIVVVCLFAFLMAYHILSSKCHSGTKKFAVHGEKHNHETKRLHLLRKRAKALVVAVVYRDLAWHNGKETSVNIMYSF